VTARTTILFLLCAAATAAGCGTAATERPAAAPAAKPPALFTVGRSLVGRGGAPVRLAAAPVAPLAGWLTPAAVPSTDGRSVAYNAWTELRADDPALSWQDQGIEAGDPLATPVLRIYDSATGSDQVLEEGAFSLAWRGDGALAYFKGAERDYRAGIPYVGHILVRSTVTASPEPWTTVPARYIVAGWAGQTLIAYEEREGEALDLLALDGPGRVRVLARDSALVAIAPNGEQALVERGPANGRPMLRVLAVADSTEEAALDLTTVDPAVAVVGYAGDWEHDLVVAPTASGLAVFRIGSGRIELTEIVRVDGGGVAEPRFAGSARERVTGWKTTGAGGTFLDCYRPSRHCSRVVPLPAARGIHGFPVWRRPVYNPSRPLEGEQ
jgi:hypothetical protein